MCKAFNTVDHKILLSKLENYGIRGTAHDWLISCLSGRSQYVSFDNATSDYLPISCGVPQGSVLGSLLFLLYTNDFSNCTKMLDIHLFPDDSNLFFADESLLNLERVVNQELSKVN